MPLLKIYTFRSLVKQLERLNFLVEAYLRTVGVPLDKPEGKVDPPSVEYVDTEVEAAMEVLAKMGRLTDRELREFKGETEEE